MTGLLDCILVIRLAVVGYCSWTVVKLVDISQAGYLNMAGAGHWPVPLTRLRLGKSGFDFAFSGTKPSARSPVI